MSSSASSTPANTPSSPPLSADNPSYFSFFSDPVATGSAEPEEVLSNLRELARHVETGQARKRRSFRSFLTNSLSRRPKKDRTQSCSEDQTFKEKRLSALMRSTSLEPKNVTTSAGAAMKSEPTSPPFYENESSVAMSAFNNSADKPPKPPERNKSSLMMLEGEQRISESQIFKRRNFQAAKSQQRSVV